MKLGSRTPLPPVVVAVVYFVVFTNALDFRYHKYKEMAEFLGNFTETHKDLSRLYSIGKSVRGKDLLVVEVTGVKGPTTGVPNVKLIGNIHGNEAVGREILLHFLEYLASSYNNDSTIRWLLDNTRLHILPSLNPDGFEDSSEGLCSKGLGRTNANNIDLNRSFPDFFRENNKHMEQETLAVTKWMDNIPFILSASLHGGALVANYPYESLKEDATSFNMESKSPDDDVFRHLATVYAQNHPTMHRGGKCPGSDTEFEGGITNGAAWYPVTGGMQDYNYIAHGCMEMTLEISCCKYPPPDELPTFWTENKLALVKYISQALQGVRGQLVDGLTNSPIKNASLMVEGRDMIFRSTNKGEFWRLLLPGNYRLKVSALGYQNQTISFDVKKSQSSPRLTALTIKMYPLGYQPTTTTTTTTQKVSVSPTDGTTYSGSSQFSDYAQNLPAHPIENAIKRGVNPYDNISPPIVSEQKSTASIPSYFYFMYIVCLFYTRI